MHKASCGPGGTHTRPRGDVLPHRRPRGHDTSPIQRSTLSTNQEQARRCKGPQPRDNGLETMQTPPYPPWDPLGSHLDENQRDRGHPRIGRSPRSSAPILRPFAPPFHASSCRDEPKAVPGVCPNICPKACNSFSRKIHQVGPHSSSPHAMWRCWIGHWATPRRVVSAHEGPPRDDVLTSGWCGATHVNHPRMRAGRAPSGTRGTHPQTNVGWCRRTRIGGAPAAVLTRPGHVAGFGWRAKGRLVGFG
jgi:hypothetical protein